MIIRLFFDSITLPEQDRSTQVGLGISMYWLTKRWVRSWWFSIEKDEKSLDVQEKMLHVVNFDQPQQNTSSCKYSYKYRLVRVTSKININRGQFYTKVVTLTTFIIVTWVVLVNIAIRHWEKRQLLSIHARMPNLWTSLAQHEYINTIHK